MGHYAFLDENNIVTEVITGRDEDEIVNGIYDWEEYYGSSKYLHEDIKELGASNFTREILHLCKSRSECAYLELKEQINREVLESDLFYNDWIQVRVRKEHLKSMR